jgi:Tol biopolymer transport system component
MRGNASTKGSMRTIVLAAIALAAVVLSAGADAAPRGTIVFSATREAAYSGQIYRLSLDRRLTNLVRSGDGGASPRVSPDGNWVAFISGRPDGSNGAVFLVPATGGTARRLTPPGRVPFGYPIWSHDGEHLLTVGQVGDDYDRLAVYVLGRTDRARRLAGTGGEFPVWSPDDRRVAFETETGGYGQQSVRVVPLSGGWGWHVRGSRPAWSPAGRLAVIGPRRSSVRTYDARGTCS